MRRASPKMRLEAACERWGRAAVVGRCDAILRGGVEEPEFILVLGGEPARRLISDGIPEDQEYWLHVWALRGLLWTGPGVATSAIGTALRDPSWRVREMACKVVARHCLEDLAQDVVPLEVDPVARVREAAHRAVIRIVGRQT